MSNIQILAVDDDPIIRKLLEISLLSERYQAAFAENGSQAIAALECEHFDVVITDLEMGDPDGFRVLERAKALNPLSRRIVITGNQDVSSAIKAINIGVEGYVLKPFSPVELLDCVQKNVDQLEFNQKSEREYAEAISLVEQIYPKMLFVSHDIRSALISMGASLRILKKRVNEEMVVGTSDELDKLSSRCAKLTTILEEYLNQIFFLINNPANHDAQELHLLHEIIAPVFDELYVDP